LSAMNDQQNCSVEGCDFKPHAKGWCRKHYDSRRRYSDSLILLNFPPAHGTIGMYTNHGCRCDACRKANRENQLRSMRENPEQRAKHQARSRQARAVARLSEQDARAGVRAQELAS
jgi:hypothetical protein